MRCFRSDVVGSIKILLLPALAFVICSFGYAQAADRTEKVVLELASPIDDPKNFNWFFPNVRRDQGAHQAMFEPLFLFNYKTGALDPWLAKSSTPNALQDVWPLKVRADVKWSDSKPGREGEAQGWLTY